MIDTHCHLNFKVFKKDYKEVYKRAIESGVKKMIVVGARLDSSEKAVEQAQELELVYASVGIHPYHVDEFEEKVKRQIGSRLKKLVVEKKVIAIGECGLDYYRYKKDLIKSHNKKAVRKLQKELLLFHIKLSKELHLPVIIHCRRAWDDLINFLLQLNNQLKWEPQGVFHCFSGTREQLKQVIEMGFYVGFDGNITYKESKALHQVVKKVPLDRLLIETDAPFLTPQPYRGSRNEPAYVRLVADKIAEIKHISKKLVVDLTSENAHKLFKFSRF